MGGLIPAIIGGCVIGWVGSEMLHTPILVNCGVGFIWGMICHVIWGN